MSISQAELAKNTGINRSVLSNLENQTHTPSMDQLQALSEVLEFDPTAMFKEEPVAPSATKNYNIAVAGTGYVGLSLAVLLAHHNIVTAVDILPEKVEKLNNYMFNAINSFYLCG